MAKKYDFSGYATRNNIRCSDGRTIRQNAFKNNDGQTVPLVWNHDHKSADRVLGHALLENREDGVYAYCSFNNTEQGRNAKELVLHGDIKSLSIYANQLKQIGGDVIHGAIKEVSLVLAGSNPGALIETVIEHSEDTLEEAVIYNPVENLEFCHMDDSDPDDEIKTPQNEEEKKVAEQNKTESEKTVQDVFDSMTEEQKNVCYFLIGKALEEKQSKTKDDEEDEEVKHNVFENDNANDTVLTHDEFTAIMTTAKKNGSVKEAFLAHGIDGVENLFPEAQTVNKTPEMIQREMTWVQKVMSAVHHTPFSRVKSTAANITEEAARAKGYIKGKQKKEEVISALKRVTTPQTVYKLQKMDRDDVLDITEFDVIAWLKSEMRLMLDEEIARAILIGDGRPSDSEDKIDPTHIRPVLGDNSVYTVAKELSRADDDTDESFANNFIKLVKKSRKEYKGSGYPSLFVTEDLLTNMLLIEDKNGRVIYDTIEKLTTALRVKEIIPVPVFDDVVRTNDEETIDYKLLGLLVNLLDYNVGADKGGAVNMFEDFDIDYNKQAYLIETRCSGALTKPYSAVSFEEKVVRPEPAKG